MSGVLAFLLAGWSALKGKTTGFRAFAAFAVLCLFIACFLAWEDEYRKNIGDAFFTFSPEDVNTISDEKVNVKITVRNEMTKTLEIDEIRIVRVSIKDLSPSLNQSTNNWCKEVSASPFIDKSNKDAKPWMIRSNTMDYIYQYLDNFRILIDGTETRSTAVLLEAGKGHIFAITATGPDNSSEYNGTILCPVVVYFSASIRRGMVCPGVGKFISPGGRTHTFGETNRWFLRGVKPEDRCHAFGILG